VVKSGESENGESENGENFIYVVVVMMMMIDNRDVFLFGDRKPDEDAKEVEREGEQAGMNRINQSINR